MTPTKPPAPVPLFPPISADGGPDLVALRQSITRLWSGPRLTHNYRFPAYLSAAIHDARERFKYATETQLICELIVDGLERRYTATGLPPPASLRELYGDCKLRLSIEAQAEGRRRLDALTTLIWALCAQGPSGIDRAQVELDDQIREFRQWRDPHYGPYFADRARALGQPSIDRARQALDPLRAAVYRYRLENGMN